MLDHSNSFVLVLGRSTEDADGVLVFLLADGFCLIDPGQHPVFVLNHNQDEVLMVIRLIKYHVANVAGKAN